MLNIIDFTALVKTSLEAHDSELEHVEQWVTKEGTIYFKCKYHLGKRTYRFCHHVTHDERMVLKRGTDVHFIEELRSHLVRGNTHG